MQRETLIHDGPGGPFESMIVRDDVRGAGTRPGVMVFPNVLGLKESDYERAERLAALGYTALAVDLFGQGKRTKRGDPDMARYMNELNADRALLRDRLIAAHARLKSLPGVDPARTGAIGFCFGGKAVLDLARAGADLRGGISFHGVYDPPPFPNDAISTKLLICHGWDDPISPPAAMAGLANELTAANADWQIHIYGGAGHAFTDKSIDQPGLGWREAADRRSWQAMTDFLAEALA